MSVKCQLEISVFEIQLPPQYNGSEQFEHGSEQGKKLVSGDYFSKDVKYEFSSST